MDTLPSLLELKKYSKAVNETDRRYEFAILGDSATQYLNLAIKGYARMMHYDFSIYESDYDQIDLMLLDTASEYYASSPKMTLLYLCNEKLYEQFFNTPLEERGDFASKTFEKIYGRWKRIRENTKSKIMQTLFIEVNDGIFGNYCYNVPSSFPSQVKLLNSMIIQAIQAEEGVYALDLNAIAMTTGLSNFVDDRQYYLAKMPIDNRALPYVAKCVVDIVAATQGKIKKCAILDLDNTLWGGIIGDDGLDGIQIGELGSGQAFVDFQRYLKELRNRGILLAVCSKNEADAAKEPFIKHPDMVLRLEDISIFVANWDDKVSNIRHIQKVLNLGMDSFVFIDDNPFERNHVREMIPEVTVPEMPEDPSEYTSYLRSLNLFETASFSNEDRMRTAQYREEANRVESMDDYDSYESYLRGLEMKATVARFDNFHVPRIAQLTQRSNQFNLRTIRLSEDDVVRISSDPDYIPLYVTMSDKYGEYGLISVLILERKAPDTALIYEWLMSCRVLKRGAEEFIINSMVEIARKEGIRKIIGEYIETPKNRMVASIYPNLGFTAVSENVYELSVDDYVPKTTYVVGRE